MTFSIGSAVGSGFALVGRRPLSVVSWGFFIGYSIVSTIINLIFSGAAMASILASSGGGASASDPSVILAHWPLMLLAYLPTFILGAAFNGVFQAIVQGPWAEVYREMRGSPEVASTFA